MVPFKPFPKRDIQVSPVIEPTLEGMVPFKPLLLRFTAVISPFAHVTHTGSEVSQLLPPHEQGSSLSELHTFQLFGPPG
jgi:hypothetical protein